jgi:hypothetical protein
VASRSVAAATAGVGGSADMIDGILWNAHHYLLKKYVYYSPGSSRRASILLERERISHIWRSCLYRHLGAGIYAMETFSATARSR